MELSTIYHLYQIFREINDDFFIKIFYPIKSNKTYNKTNEKPTKLSIQLHL